MAASPTHFSRRGLIVAGASLTALPVLADADCRGGPPAELRGPAVFLDYDQAALDAAYDPDAYEAGADHLLRRLAGLSADLRASRGSPLKVAYGERRDERLDIYRTETPRAPIFVVIHGGGWHKFPTIADCAFAAEAFLDAGAHFVAVGFSQVRIAGRDQRVLADQIRRGIAWVARNAESFGGDPDRIFVGGHSSGGNLAAVALTTDWERRFDLPPDVIKGGLCISGLYELAPVALSYRRHYIDFPEEAVAATSPARHLDRLAAPVVVAWGSLETPEYQRQGRDFVTAIAAAGKPVRAVVGLSYHHQEMWESLGNPYGVAGRAALAMMGLGRA